MQYVINVPRTILIYIIFKSFSGGHGHFVVQLSNNRMFYGTAHIGHVVEVSKNNMNQPYSYSRYLAGASLKLTLMQGISVQYRLRIRKWSIEHRVVRGLEVGG